MMNEKARGASNKRAEASAPNTRSAVDAAPLCPTSRIVHVLAKWVIFVTRGDVKQSAIEGKQDPPTTTTQDNKNNDNDREGAVIGSHVWGRKERGRKTRSFHEE